MFNNLFTTYYNLDPPPIKRSIDLGNSQLIEINPYLYEQNISPDNSNWSFKYPEETNPFSFKADQPVFSSPTPIKTNTVAQSAVDLARSFLGGEYVWGGKNPSQGFDCSGIISYVYKQNGIDIPAHTLGLFKTGKEVSLSNAQAGDIICTPGSGRSGRHVKMISKVENGQIYTIEAKGKKYGIVETPLDRTDNIITIRRITDKHIQKDVSSNGSFSNKSDFVNTLNNTYKEVLKEHGLDMNYSYILTSAAALESGWGQHLGGNFNYGGVKGKTGAVKSTIDFVNNQYIRRNQTFKNFNSVKDYCNYVVNLLSNNRYNAFNKYSSSNPMALWRHVLDAGYGGGNEAGKDAYMNSVRKIYNTIKNIV